VNQDQLSTILTVLVIVSFIVFIIAVIIVAVIVSRKRAQERTRQLTSVATLLGWQFSPVAAITWIPKLETFALFNQGHSKSITNAMYGEIEGVKAAVFDYRYTVGGGKNSQTFTQSVVYFEMPNLNLPFFSLRPENFLHKLIEAFGYQDIDFGNHPTFSSKYLLRGPDEQGVRNLFNDALLSFYETNLGLSADGGGNQLFIFQQNYRQPPHQIQLTVNAALHLQRLYGNRW
jgi:multisubunit Na+/H+ antiporter MnhB subunit